jgi:nucleoside-diphosphate-sugar epimerase
LGGGAEPVSLNQVIAKLESLIGKKATIEYRKFHKADMKTTSADISKASSHLGWSPMTSLDDGLKACVDWYLENKPWSARVKLP